MQNNPEALKSGDAKKGADANKKSLVSTIESPQQPSYTVFLDEKNCQPPPKGSSISEIKK